MTRNPKNQSLVLSEIKRRAELLIEATETAISLTPTSSHSANNLVLLPAVQAMLIYQCMRLLSTGDIAQQTQAELDAKSLARWVDILQEQTQWSWESLSSGTQLNLRAWKDWVQAESIRRTIIFAELLHGIYTFLRFGWYQPSARMAKLSFTGQVDIWEARSPTEWLQATEQKPWVELDMSSFHDGIKAVSPEDLDELGIIILASYDGVDALEEWVGGDKRLLDKWGLSGGNGFFSSCR
ncbi:Ff.00g064050.m01.CDS01 [Fusarium sp. VM40]|nr:Ff.00g064050.m01.CDS01 [Fusarium sp. VM40]